MLEYDCLIILAGHSWYYGVWRTKQPLLEVTEFYSHSVFGDANPAFKEIHFVSHESPGHPVMPESHDAFSGLAELPESPLCLARLKPPVRCKWVIY